MRSRKIKDRNLLMDRMISECKWDRNIEIREVAAALGC